MRKLIFGLCLAVAPVAHAQVPGPSRETMAAPAQPGVVQLMVNAPDQEIWHLDNGLAAVRNVTRPTLMPFLPTGKASGAAVIIAPGGGFLGLAIEKEGWQIARYCADHGIAAFVLKYRVLHTPTSQPEFVDQLARAIKGEKVGFGLPDDTPPEALADGMAALRYVRGHAAEYHIDPKRVGFMGFSAGGFLTRSIVENAGAEMPAFVAPIYPNMTPLKVPDNAPPMFVAVAADDFLLAKAGGPHLFESYQAAGKSIEFHLFASGGHGFGPAPKGSPAEGWLDLWYRWLRARAIIKD